jgi:hypothetical protein
MDSDLESKGFESGQVFALFSSTGGRHGNPRGFIFLEYLHDLSPRTRVYQLWQVLIVRFPSCSGSTLYIDVYIAEHPFRGIKQPAGPKKVLETS